MWGNRFWNLLHVISVTASERPWIVFIFLTKVLPELLPCHACYTHHIIQMMEGHMSELSDITILSKEPLQSDKRRYDLIAFVCMLRYQVAMRNINCRKKVNMRLHDAMLKYLNVEVPFGSSKNKDPTIMDPVIRSPNVKKLIMKAGKFVPFHLYCSDLWFVIHASSFVLPGKEDGEALRASSANRSRMVAWFMKHVPLMLPQAHFRFAAKVWNDFRGQRSATKTLGALESYRKEIDVIFHDRSKVISFMYFLHSRMRERYRTGELETCNHVSLSKHVKTYKEFVFTAMNHENVVKMTKNSGKNKIRSSLALRNVLSESQKEVIRVTRTLHKTKKQIDDTKDLENHLEVQRKVDNLIRRDSVKTVTRFMLQNDKIKKILNLHRMTTGLAKLVSMMIQSDAVLHRGGDESRSSDNSEHNFSQFGVFTVTSGVDGGDDDFIKRFENAVITETDVREITERNFRFEKLSIERRIMKMFDSNSTSSSYKPSDDRSRNSCCQAMDYSNGEGCKKSACIQKLSKGTFLCQSWEFCKDHGDVIKHLQIAECANKLASVHLNIVDSIVRFSSKLAHESIVSGSSGVLLKEKVLDKRTFPFGFCTMEDGLNVEMASMSFFTANMVIHMLCYARFVFLSRSSLLLFLCRCKTCAYRKISTESCLRKVNLWNVPSFSPNTEEFRNQIRMYRACSRIENELENKTMLLMHTESEQVVHKLFYNPDFTGVVGKEDVKVCAWIGNEKVPTRTTMRSIKVLAMSTKKEIEEVKKKRNVREDEFMTMHDVFIHLLETS